MLRQSEGFHGGGACATVLKVPSGNVQAEEMRARTQKAAAPSAASGAPAAPPAAASNDAQPAAASYTASAPMCVATPLTQLHASPRLCHVP